MIDRLYSHDYVPTPFPPEDLVSPIGLLSQVVRYQHADYPDIFTGQTVDVHTKRCVDFWRRRMWDSAVDIHYGERILWVHDIPEITIGDFVATVKNDKQDSERAAAKQRLQYPDYLLYLRFEKASRFLKGEMSQSSDPTALAARLIDVLDGNIIFNERIAQFCQAGGRLSANMDSALIYSFLQSDKMRSQLALLPRNAWGLADLLDLQSSYVRGYWSTVSADRAPGAIQGQLSQ